LPVLAKKMFVMECARNWLQTVSKGHCIVGHARDRFQDYSVVRSGSSRWSPAERAVCCDQHRRDGIRVEMPKQPADNDTGIPFIVCSDLGGS